MTETTVKPTHALQTSITVSKAVLKENALGHRGKQSLRYEIMRKENTLFDLRKENLKLRNEKLKLEIYGLKRG